jgi:hypothetical protein
MMAAHAHTAPAQRQTSMLTLQLGAGDALSNGVRVREVQGSAVDRGNFASGHVFDDWEVKVSAAGVGGSRTLYQAAPSCHH